MFKTLREINEGLKENNALLGRLDARLGFENRLRLLREVRMATDQQREPDFASNKDWLFSGTEEMGIIEDADSLLCSKKHQDHYNRIASDYHDRWYGFSYIKFCNQLLEEHISLELGRPIIADIGGGNGAFASLLESMGASVHNIEPNKAMLSQQTNANVVRINDTAESYFSKKKIACYTHLLIKETIHHIDHSVTFFKSLHPSLFKGGKLVIITRPKESPLPLPAQALKAYSATQPSKELLMKNITEAGFSDVKISESCYHINIPLEEWNAMLRSRFMSCLSELSAAEIENGIAELDLRYPEGVIEINDVIYTITATSNLDEMKLDNTDSLHKTEGSLVRNGMREIVDMPREYFDEHAVNVQTNKASIKQRILLAFGASAALLGIIIGLKAFLPSPPDTAQSWSMKKSELRALDNNPVELRPSWVAK